jgi:zinc protease
MRPARPGHTAGGELEKGEQRGDRTAAHQARSNSAESSQARNTIETQTIGRLENLNGVANMLNEYNHYLKTPDYLQKDIERIRAVTPASLMAFAREQLQPNARAVVYAVKGTPELGSQVPTPPAPTATGTGTESVNVDEAWRNEIPKPGPAKALQVPVPGDCAARERPHLDSQHASRAAHCRRQSGCEERQRHQSARRSRPRQLHRVDARSGTATRTAVQIANQVAELGATVNANSSMDASFVTARSLKKNFAATLDLAADIALHPSFPAEEIERQRSSRLAQLVQQRENANVLAVRISNLALYGERHPYGYTELGTEVSVRALTREAMLNFWKQNFVPNNSALVVAGDITMAELRPLAEKVFGGWQRGMPAMPSLAAPASTQARILIVDRPGAPQTQLRVATIGAPRSVPEFQPIQVMNTALGGLFSSRINMNLREEHGYTYGAGSGFDFRRGAGPFAIASGCPDRCHCARGDRDPEGSARDGGIADEDRGAGAGERRAHAIAACGLSDQPGCRRQLRAGVHLRPGLDYYSHVAERVNAVTGDQALAAAKKYLVPERMVIVAVGDRAKIEPELRKLNVAPVEVVTPDGKPVG